MIYAAAFWDAFDKQTYSKTARVLLEIFLAGGKIGTAQLPEPIQLLLNWDVFNRRATDYLKLYQLNTVPDITEVTRKNAVRVIGDWIESGENFDMLSMRLEPWLGESRARRIAVTEVTRTYAAGNIASWQSTGMVSQKVWRTARDERVCPICGPLHGAIVNLDGSFMLDDNALPRGLAGSGADFIYFAPPAHVNCRCWLQPVVDTEMVRARRRRELDE